jgi:hypothetical protein
MVSEHRFGLRLRARSMSRTLAVTLALFFVSNCADSPTSVWQGPILREPQFSEGFEDCPPCRRLSASEMDRVWQGINNHINTSFAFQCNEAYRWLSQMAQSRAGMGVHEGWGWYNGDPAMGHDRGHGADNHIAINGGTLANWTNADIGWGLLHEYAHHFYGYEDDRLADEFAEMCFKW